MQPGVHRVTYLDYSRGILICLVTVGHSLQHLVLQDQNFYSDGMFKFIYMFHMPLFMVISGYVAFPSIKRVRFGAFLKRKTKSYLVPILVWALIWTTFALAVGSNTLMNLRPSGLLARLGSRDPPPLVPLGPAGIIVVGMAGELHGTLPGSSVSCCVRLRVASSRHKHRATAQIHVSFLRRRILPRVRRLEQGATKPRRLPDGLVGRGFDCLLRSGRTRPTSTYQACPWLPNTFLCWCLGTSPVP